MPITIAPPDPDWPRHFAALGSRLAPLVPPGAAIHHIGSTAVPGLAAKPIIDVQITVPNLADLDPGRLAASGFVRGRPVSDHCPPGMTLPAPELRKLFFKAQTPYPAHVHIRESGRFNARYPLLCRDYLRAHPLAAAAYASVKRGLAHHFPTDVDAYYDIKDPVFDILMAGAEAWARSTNWTLPPPDAP